ncbi:uncharacterized protein BKA55DRAFT_635146 [Fusarium redolens]|uniref:Uncharacterized protein n=1 Tax=Fusarium redolens TaxID=48865 RepID=A0A9P9KSV1_FUSRE|nr:uncharacterized protein BKA55DRAFT_635146 [Fusarium redolens]KAH7267881.1 hypothetical protein BKA55DRAFT_635146 [Fusarium redolens]
MSCLNHQPDESRHFKQGRRHHHHHNDKDDSYRRHHHHRHIHNSRLDDNGMNYYERPEGWRHLSDRLGVETLITKMIEMSGDRGVQSPKRRSNSQHALQKGVRIGAEVAYRIRNDRGPWAGEKAIKVISAAVASATIDLLLDTDSKNHPLTHAAVVTVEGVIIDRIINGIMKL